MLNRLNDVLIKFILANESRKNLTIGLVNSVIEKFNSNKIIDFTFKDREFSSESYSAKSCRLDVLGKTDSNANVNLEVQVKKLNDYDKRDLFYWAKIFSSDLAAGQPYANLNKTININILDFVLFPYEDTPDFHNCFKIKNMMYPNHLYSDDLEIHTIEIPKLEKIKIDLKI